MATKVRRIPDSERTAVMRAALHGKWGQTSQGDARRHAIIEQVPHAPRFDTGFSDVLVMHLWHSDRLRILGYELKASRGDLKRELAKPEKSAKVRAQCDEWWLLVWDVGVLSGLEAEIPAAWGIAVMKGDGEDVPYTIKTHRKPGVSRRDPEPMIPRPFVAAMMRRALEHAPTAAYVADIVAAASYRARYQGKEDGRHAATRELWELVWDTLGDLGTVKPNSATGLDQWGRHTNESALTASLAAVRARLADAEAAVVRPARSA